MRSKRAIAGGITLSLLTAFAGGYWVSRARASGPPQTAPLTYSGVISDMNGVPLTGSKMILLGLYAAATGGNVLCSSVPTTVTLVGGAFQLPLMDNCTPIINAMPDLWIDVFVDSVSVGRAKLGAVPYAIEAAHAASATFATNAQTAASAQAVAPGAVANNLTYISVRKSELAYPGDNPDVYHCIDEGDSIVDCYCPSGTVLSSGGAIAYDLADPDVSTRASVIRASHPVSTTIWEFVCAAADGSDAYCQDYFILCSRIGPSTPPA
jgi:hypothetical protein